MKQMKMSEEFLLIHGWVPDPREGSEDAWNHPLDFKIPKPLSPERSPGYPYPWSLDEAVKIELQGQQYQILESEGWDVEWGGQHGPGGTYYGHIGKVRSPASNGRRRILTVGGAFKILQKRGWEKAPDPTLPAVRKNSTLFVWCRYCADWHKHGDIAPLSALGDDAGHRSSHCVFITPYSGYSLKIALVTPEGLSPYRTRARAGASACR